MATIHDVAKLAGVSVMTVSNVVNGHPHVRASTRAKVLAAIDVLDYRPNRTARSLRSGRTQMIGLALPDLTSPYMAELAAAVMREAQTSGHTVLIEQTDGQLEKERQVLSAAHRSGTDGLIMSPIALTAQDLAELKINFPLVMIGERPFDGLVDHVTMRNVEAARAATLHLIEGDRKRILALGVEPGICDGAAGLRLQGYREAIHEAGLGDDPSLEVAASWKRPSGATAIEQVLDAGIAFDAVFALVDVLALGAIRTLQERGLRVPADVAIVGFDDIEESQFSRPALTSIAPGRDQIAQTSVELLTARIDSGDLAAPYSTVWADFELIRRESS